MFDDLLMEGIISDKDYFDFLMELNSNGFYSNEGIWNSLIKIHNKNYRERVEALIINDNSVFIARRSDGSYQLPGGGTEKDKTDIEQLIAECQEEANITIVNPKYVDSYKIEFNKNNPAPKWMNSLPIKYDGMITKVYIADYCSEYTKYVDPIDRSSFIKNGKFIPIKQALTFLRPEHRKAFN